MAREEKIKQELEQVENLFRDGKMSRPLYESKKLLLQEQLSLCTENKEQPPSSSSEKIPAIAAPTASTSQPSHTTKEADSATQKSNTNNSPQKEAAPPTPQSPPQTTAHAPKEPDHLIGQIFRQRYKLIETLGEGSTGQVFLAEDIRFGGNYTLKRLHPKLTSDPEKMLNWVSTFYEHQRLRNTCIVRTYQIDDDAKHAFFYVREYIKGESLNAILQRFKKEKGFLPNQSTLQIFQYLRNALKEAHEKNFFQIEINPHNIFLPSEVEDSPIKLLDFHFSGHLGQATQHFNLKSKKTLYYTAPELLSESSQGYTQKSNIFSIAALLYQMMTGNLPIAVTALPSQINSQIPVQVDQVLKKAMHPQPQHRYHSIDEMSHDLYEAFTSPTPGPSATMEREAPTSKPDMLSANLYDPTTMNSQEALPMGLNNASPMPTLPSSPPRNKSTLPSTPGSFQGASKLSPPPPYHAQFPALPGPSPSRKDSAHPYTSQKSKNQLPPSRPTQTTDTKKEQTTLHSQSYVSRNIGFTQSTTPRTEKTKSGKSSVISNAERIARLRSGKHQSKAPEESLEELPKTPPKQKLLGHKKGILSLCVSPNGQFLVSTSYDATVRLWDTQSWYPLYNIEVADGAPTNVCWSHQQDLFAYSDAKGNILIHDLSKQEWRWKIPTGQACYGISWHPTAASLLIALSDGTLSWWNLDSQGPTKQQTLQAPSVQAIALHDQRQFILAGDSSGLLSCWRGNREQPTWQPEHLPSSISVIQCFPVQQKTIVGDRDGKLHLFNLNKKTHERSWSAHKKGVRSLVIPSHEKWFASCSNDQRIHLWYPAEEQPICTLSHHQGSLRALASAPSGDWIASGGEESSICIWDTSLWR